MDIQHPEVLYNEVISLKYKVFVYGCLSETGCHDFRIGKGEGKLCRKIYSGTAV